MAGIGKAKRDEVVRRRLLGESVTEIAKALSVSTPAISDTLKQPEVVQKLADAREAALAAALATLEDAAGDAVAVLVKQLGSEDERIANKAANDILDRARVGKQAEGPSTAIQFNIDTLSVEQLRALAEGGGE